MRRTSELTSRHEAPVSQCLYNGPGQTRVLMNIGLASEKLIKTCGVSAYCRPGDQAGQPDPGMLHMSPIITSIHHPPARHRGVFYTVSL